MAGDLNSVGYNIPQNANPQPVALSGRVPVKISSSSSPISIGDYVTSSNEPGKGMKAQKPGFVVGKALENWTPNSQKDTVVVYVSYIWADPTAALAFDDMGNLNISGTITAQDLVSQPTPNDPVVTLADLNANLSNLTDDVASMSAQIATLQSQVQNLITPDSLWSLATDSAKLVSTLPVEVPEISILGNSTLTGNLTVSGTTLLSTTNITGQLSVGILKFDDMLGDISSLTGLISFNSGAVSIDSQGNITSLGEITAKKYNVNTSDVLGSSVGKSTIPAGLQELVVDTTAVSTSSSIFVTPEGNPIPVSTEATQSGEFIIRIPETLPTDLKVNWWVIN
jgi:hypothetical protein